MRVSAWVARKRELAWQRRMRSQSFRVWTEWVEDARRRRGRKAYDLLLRSLGRRRTGLSAHRTALVADKHWRAMLRRRAWRAWRAMVLSRKRLRGMVVAALTRKAGQHVGMAFVVWARTVREMRRADAARRKEGGPAVQRQRRRRRRRAPDRCHMCLHVACPESCLYLAEKRAMRRSAWRFIEL